METVKPVKKGYILIWNFNSFQRRNRERDGSEEDVSQLKNQFKTFGFEVRVKRDSTYENFYNILDKFIKDALRGKCDMLVIAIMSHGGHGDFFFSSDDKKIFLHDIRFR